LRGGARRLPPGAMNRLEAAYAQHLEALKALGDIADWRYAAFGLKLADATRYHPDFWVLENDGSMTFDETKGFMRDDANVKLKTAASMYPWFRFRLVQKGTKAAKGTWIIQEIPANGPVADSMRARSS
jgi:hypothetical protein